METYFPVVKKRDTKGKDPFTEFALKTTERTISISVSQGVSSSAFTKELLKTLSVESNPITHSDIYGRTDHFVSFSTGHQVSNGRRRGVVRADEMDRKAKLRAQCEDVELHSTSTSNVLNGTRIYINGYLENTTDIEMKKIILEGGGDIVCIASHCTHILTSRGLSGSKIHKILSKKRANVHVVKPEWVLDSVTLGKKRPERFYTIVKQSSTLQDFFEACS
ncbi:hypothetical protein BDN70DRAFT_935005 [Pholiota conissans]|uniref:BRCT domain-containing protein n=1 Tax=Pholiota conissans TaxID=109636 RepID=A0A9P6CRR7_9AGAR|nr:hypothetical protein BDN70DRAFT_935005 [Pholiota conissans]